MKITQIKTIRVGQFPDVIWVQIHTNAGIVGLGETWYAATTVEAAIHDYFGPLLIDKDPHEVEAHWKTMFRLSDHAGYGGAELRAISALDIALWDIKGQALKLPIYELIGGVTRHRIRIYNTLGVYGDIKDGYDIWRDPVGVAKNLLGEGIRSMKISPTDFIARSSDGQLLFKKELDRVLKPIRDIRDALGMDIQIANDGHGKWNLPNAIRIVKDMECLKLMWHEELISPLNEEAHLRLQRETNTPIAVAERLMTSYQHRRFIESGAVRIVMPDLTWTGGISETRKIAILASTHQLPIAPHDCVGPVNMFAAAHICVSQPNVMIMEYNRAMALGWYSEFVDPMFKVIDGFLMAPEEPGLGTRLKPEISKRPDATVRFSSESRDSWLTSLQRYTYPPKDLLTEISQE